MQQRSGCICYIKVTVKGRQYNTREVHTESSEEGSQLTSDKAKSKEILRGQLGKEQRQAGSLDRLWAS